MCPKFRLYNPHGNCLWQLSGLILYNFTLQFTLQLVSIVFSNRLPHKLCLLSWNTPSWKSDTTQLTINYGNNCVNLTWNISNYHENHIAPFIEVKSFFNGTCINIIIWYKIEIHNPVCMLLPWYNFFIVYLDTGM